MQIFYAPDISGKHYTLDENESRHCIKSLRMSEGTRVKLIDGKGSLYEGIINEADPKKCSIEVTSVIPDFEKRGYHLHIAISPLKNPDRLEWFIEKSVEIGIDEITPLICRYSEKPGIREERINSLIISAMKQSLKATRTILNPVSSFMEFITKPRDEKRMIAHCSGLSERAGISEVCFRNEKALILIGPEGDFSEEEIRMAIENKFIPVHLGRSRLRTETAGVAACHSVYFINQ